MEHKIFYALDDNKNIVKITDSITKGKKLYCPCCTCTVFAVNKGSKIKHHFRHDYEHFDYEHKGESEIHNYSKNVLKFILENYLVEIKTCCDLLSISSEDYSQVVLEKPCEFLRWDVACLDMDNNIKYGFEVKHTHKAEEKTRQGNIWFEIEASEIVNLEEDENKKIILNCIRRCEKCLNKKCTFRRVSNITNIQRCQIPDVIIEQCNAGYGKTERLTDEAKAKIQSENIDYDIFFAFFPQHSQKDEAIVKLQNKTIQGREYKKDNQVHLNIEESNLCEGKQIVIEGSYDGKMRYFGTIHSFIYSINKLLGNDLSVKFEDMSSNIISNIQKLEQYFKNNNTIRYAQNTIDVNSLVYIYCDESQNMDIRFILALFTLIKIFPHWRLKCTGDVLQSTRSKYENDNIFSQWKNNQEQLKSYWNLNIQYSEPQPIYRRGKNPKILKWINSKNLYQNQGIKQMEFSGQILCEDEVFCEYESIIIKKDGTKEPDNEGTINRVLYNVKECLNLQNIKPSDFLFIHPFIRSNCFFSELQSKVADLFEKKFGDTTLTYLHKSEMSEPIDLNKSINKARFMSIHGSQGLSGRIVFVFGLSERNLLYHRTNFKELKGQSLVNVAITRSIERMFVYVPNENDSTVSTLMGIEINEKIYRSPIGFKDIINMMSIKNEFRDELFKKINTNKTVKTNRDFSTHVARFEILQTFFIHKLWIQSKTNDIKYYENQISQQIKIIKTYNICFEPDIKKYYTSRKQKDKKLESQIRHFEENKQILISNCIEMSSDGTKIEWNNELIKFCERVQDCFKNNNIEYIFDQKEDAAVLLCFALIYIMKWIDYKQIDFSSEMRKFIDIYNECDVDTDTFYQDTCLIRNSFMSIPSLNETGWKSNWKRKLETLGTDFIHLRSTMPLSYQIEQKQITIYCLKPDLNELNFENNILELVLTGWICLKTASSDNGDFPVVNDESDINFVFVALNIDSYKSLNFKDLKHILQQNRENIIKKCCDYLYYDVPLLYERYSNQSYNSFIENLKKTETYSTKYSHIFTEIKFQGRNKLLFEKFKKYVEDSIYERVSLFFEF